MLLKSKLRVSRVFAAPKDWDTSIKKSAFGVDYKLHCTFFYREGVFIVEDAGSLLKHYKTYFDSPQTLAYPRACI